MKNPRSNYFSDFFLPTILLPSDHVVPLELLDGCVPDGTRVAVLWSRDVHAEYTAVCFLDFDGFEIGGQLRIGR